MKPVAWIDYLEDSNLYDLNVSGRGTPLYFEPKQQVVRAPTYRTLTDEEILNSWEGIDPSEECWISEEQLKQFARAILKKASEK